MLNGISPLISPDLLKHLAEMGHGDELLLADAHFPGVSLGSRVLRADGVDVAPLLLAILPLFALDGSDNPAIMMAPEQPGEADTTVKQDYLRAIQGTNPGITRVHEIERTLFYERSRSAFVIVVTGELRPYGNILLCKGVTSKVPDSSLRVPDGLSS